MHNHLHTTCLTLSLILILPGAAPAAGSDVPEGQRLFEQHGCTNCHGPEGVHPTSKYAPVLKGKPSDYLLRNALAIFGGDHRSEKTRFMHDQFCIGEQPEEGCYPTPGEAELRIITRWLGGDGALSPKKTTPQGLYLTSTEAYEKIRAQPDRVLFVDVRTRGEVAFLGMPSDADANIPYMLASLDDWDAGKHNFAMVPNSAFVLRINDLLARKGLDKTAPVILICRSGSRSAKAARLLDAAGYHTVYSVTDGYEGDKARTGPHQGTRVVNGWRNAGLPWTYRLEKEKMYFEL
jgi:rhodanese-related sulfurtransferase